MIFWLQYFTETNARTLNFLNQIYILIVLDLSIYHLGHPYLNSSNLNIIPLLISREFYPLYTFKNKEIMIAFPDLKVHFLMS